MFGILLPHDTASCRVSGTPTVCTQSFLLLSVGTEHGWLSAPVGWPWAGRQNTRGEISGILRPKNRGLRGGPAEGMGLKRCQEVKACLAFYRGGRRL